MVFTSKDGDFLEGYVSLLEGFRHFLGIPVFKENKSLRNNHLLDLGPGFQIEARFPVGPGLQRNNL